MSELKNPTGPATYKQTWALFCLTKKDYRPMNLTCQEAHDLISKLMATVPGPARKSETDWVRVFNQAEQAGTLKMKACEPVPMVVSETKPGGQSWFVGGGVCGFAWVSIPFKTPVNKQFINNMKKRGLCEDRDKSRDAGRKYSPISKAYQGGFQYWVGAGGQSMQMKEAFAQGFAQVLADNGVDCYIGSRMD
jgi:hypothetical protein